MRPASGPSVFMRPSHVLLVKTRPATATPAARPTCFITVANEIKTGSPEVTEWRRLRLLLRLSRRMRR